VLKIGKKWSDLSKSIKGRTENNIKNRINSLLKKERNSLQEDNINDIENLTNSNNFYTMDAKG
jgi:hypothetical protein